MGGWSEGTHDNDEDGKVSDGEDADEDEGYIEDDSDDED